MNESNSFETINVSNSSESNSLFNDSNVIDECFQNCNNMEGLYNHKPELRLKYKDSSRNDNGRIKRNIDKTYRTI